VKVPVSVLVPVKNEAGNLRRCLASVSWAGQVVVVDSGSTDGTPEVSTALGAEVVQFELSGTWPKKKNWALDHVRFKYEWVFVLDADEVLPPNAEQELRGIVTSGEDSHAGYWINRRLMFMGKWLEHAYYPNWNLRLFKHRAGRYEQLTDADTASGDNEVHEHVVVDGPTGFLSCEIDHHAFPTVEVFVEKHNRYSNWEAHVALAAGQPAAARLQHRRVARRRALKRAAQRMPLRPLLRFLYVYVWQRGFLDGREGYYFARLHAFYEFLTIAKTFEMRKRRRMTPEGPPQHGGTERGVHAP
jgi:glycosyltransferase involved in cell wall biosynthesis